MPRCMYPPLRIVAWGDGDGVTLLELGERDDSLGLEADIDDHGLVGDLDHTALDHFILADLRAIVLLVSGEDGGKVFHGKITAIIIGHRVG